MARFSPSDAAFEGFRVLQKHWRVVVGWALFNIVAEVAAIVVTAVVAAGVSLAGAAGSGVADEIGGLIWVCCAAVITAMLVTGLYRLMLRPGEPGFIHLRLGRDELRLLLVWAVMAFVAFLFVGLCALAQSVAGRASLVVWVVLFAVGVWLSLRFLLAPVASFADRRVGFGVAWRTSRGETWSLLGMSVLAACFIALVVLVVSLIVALTVGFTAGFGTLFESFGNAEALKAHPALYLGEAAFQLVLTPVLMVLAAAPAVAAWQAITEDSARPRGPWDRA
jgi:hypothetical protein